MPVEETTVRWSEQLSPFVTVAKLRLPKQDIGADETSAAEASTRGQGCRMILPVTFWLALSLNAWRISASG
jgi:hypothetical protein